MERVTFTDEQVEAEIVRLQQSELVRLGKKEFRLKNKRRQYMYQLRAYEKRGKELAEVGVTLGNINDRLAATELELIEEEKE